MEKGGIKLGTLEKGNELLCIKTDRYTISSIQNINNENNINRSQPSINDSGKGEDLGSP